MGSYTFKIKLINEDYVTVEANSFDEAVDLADYKASELAYGKYEKYSIEEENE